MILKKTIDFKIPEFNLKVKYENGIEESHVIDSYIKQGYLDGLITLHTEVDESVSDKLMLQLKSTNVYITIKKDAKGFFIEELKKDDGLKLFLQQIIFSREILDNKREYTDLIEETIWKNHEIMPYPNTKLRFSDTNNFSH